MFSIFVDADSVPKKLREIIIRRLIREDIPSYFVCDRDLSDVKTAILNDVNSKREPLRGKLDREELKKIKSNMHLVVVETAENAADDEIVRLSSPPCLCITHDIPLAKRLVDKGALVIDDRGNTYTKENINERLSERNIMKAFRESGVEAEKTKRFDSRTYNEFSSAFDKAINALRPEPEKN